MHRPLDNRRPARGVIKSTGRVVRESARKTSTAIAKEFRVDAAALLAHLKTGEANVTLVEGGSK